MFVYTDICLLKIVQNFCKTFAIWWFWGTFWPFYINSWSQGSVFLGFWWAIVISGCPSSVVVRRSTSVVCPPSSVVCQHLMFTEHYLLQCSQFTTQRIRMFHATRPFHTLSALTLLFGKSSLSDEDNSTIFIAVQNFIKDTGRFT